MKACNTLFEAELTDKQIDGILTNAEKVAVQSGDNKTALGKVQGVVGDPSKKITSTDRPIIESGTEQWPVKNFDAQFEKLKAELKKKLQGKPNGFKR